MSDSYVDVLRVFLNPISPFLKDPDVTDISIYGKGNVNIRKRGTGFEPVNASWTTDENLMSAVKTIGEQMGRQISNRDPILDARLPDKSRVSIIVSPCYDPCACIVIRKFPEYQFSLEDLKRFGTIDDNGMTILETIVRMEKNILIAGGTGSGKTTILNSLCAFIPDTDVVVTIEDAREISISNRLCVPLESKRAIDDEDKEITLNDLVRASLRINPRWLVVGEVRGDEASDLIRAFTTGHAGMGTIHANSAEDALMALGSLLWESRRNITARAIKEMVSRAIHIVVYARMLPDYSRKLMEIIEVQGLDRSNPNDSDPPYKIRTLYKYEFEKYDANKKAVGRFCVEEPPSWIDQLKLLPDFRIPEFWLQ